MQIKGEFQFAPGDAAKAFQAIEAASLLKIKYTKVVPVEAGGMGV
jgi:hypothetical protein